MAITTVDVFPDYDPVNDPGGAFQSEAIPRAGWYLIEYAYATDGTHTQVGIRRMTGPNTVIKVQPDVLDTQSPSAWPWYSLILWLNYGDRVFWANGNQVFQVVFLGDDMCARPTLTVTPAYGLLP